MNADWFGAVSTAVGSVGTVGALWFLAVQQKALNRDQRERDEDARRVHAALVHVWEEKIPVPIGGLDHGQLSGPPPPKPPSPRPMSCGVRVRNAGDAPVYDVTLVFLDPGGAGELIARVGAVGPRDEKHVAAPQAISVNVEQMTAVVTFVDGAGRCWWRSHRGILNDGPYVHPIEGLLVPWS